MSLFNILRTLPHVLFSPLQWHHPASDLDMLGDILGLFVAVSAHLYSFTRNSTYLSAAELTVQFVEDHVLLDNVVANINVSDCSLLKTEPDTEASGLFLEGVTIVADLTQNQTWIKWRDIMVLSIVDGPWNSPIGVITEALSSIIKGTIFRAPSEVRTRNPGTPIINLIDAYTYVQLNAIIASSSGSVYSDAWVGPLGNSVNSGGSISAIDVFNYGFRSAANATISSASVTPLSTAPPADSPSNTTPSTSLSSNKASAWHHSVIIGGSVGSVLLVSVVALGILAGRRYGWWKTLSSSKSNLPLVLHTIDPYPYMTPPRVVSVEIDPEAAHEMNHEHDQNGDSTESIESPEVLPRGSSADTRGTAEQFEVVRQIQARMDTKLSEITQKLAALAVTSGLSERGDRSVREPPSYYSGERGIVEGTPSEP